MLMNGAEYLESLRDGRTIRIGSETVRDVTNHPAFKNAARSFARIWDARTSAEHGDALCAEENGERFPAYYLMPKSRADLEHRTRSATAIADLSYGMMGRSPDFIGGYVTGAAMQPEMFKTDAYDFSANMSAYYKHCRDKDIFLSHAVAPPQGTRDPEHYGRTSTFVPTLSVTSEGDDGVVINGVKLLATAAAFSHEVWIGNILPLAPGREAEAVTCAIPVNSPGLELWSRKPYERFAQSEYDNPLAYRYDESDCVVICRDVKVPWERVLTLGDIAWSRNIYFDTPAHTLSNHQAAVRYRSKLKLLLGIAKRVTESMGTDKVPAVADTLNHLSAMHATISAMIAGQIQDHETLKGGLTCYNRRYMYAAVYFATQNYDKILARIRELTGGSVLQMPADASVMDDDETKRIFEMCWSTETWDAKDKMKLFKLAWDILGTDFAGRHSQYERFYMGPAFIVREHVSRETDWAEIEEFTDALLASYDAPGDMD
ncbi:MAG: 4-hydroxyphenylacetate 3-hydroxylase N-terminal domain-containing protein [Pseudomonadota bacterium]|nr:4-hydroxyphenylacetate 3-hydroxylase N-terminal domain-containing protein [Pseudomonadota bacterium]